MLHIKIHLVALLGLAFLCTCVMAKTDSMAPVTQPTTLFNGQSACVQYGGCTKGSNTFKTESYSSPVSKGPSHSVPYLTNAEESSSYIASFASQGGRAAYDPQNRGSSTAVPPATSVHFNTQATSSNGQTYTNSYLDNSSITTRPMVFSNFVPSIVLATATIFVVGAVVL